VNGSSCVGKRAELGARKSRDSIKRHMDEGYYIFNIGLLRLKGITVRYLIPVESSTRSEES